MFHLYRLRPNWNTSWIEHLSCGARCVRFFYVLLSKYWMSICVICDRCGVLGSPVDWEFDADKSDPSYAKHTAPLHSKTDI